MVHAVLPLNPISARNCELKNQPISVWQLRADGVSKCGIVIQARSE